MIIVSVAFVICWFPTAIYFIVLNTTQMSGAISMVHQVVGSYTTLLLSCLYICMNPFIYAFKHYAVRKKLARLMICANP